MKWPRRLWPRPEHGGLGLALGAVIVAGAVAVVLWPGDDSQESRVTEPQSSTGDLPVETGDLVLVDQPFECTGAVDLDLVRVTIRTVATDAIRIGPGCTGRIGRVEVETWAADGIVVTNLSPVATDLVIESGYVVCHSFAPGAHQDGIQAMGGERITFRDLRIDCLGNANFFVATGGSHASTPSAIVCEGCVLGPRAAQTAFIASSADSGVRGTTICTGRFRAVRIEAGAEGVVDDENVILPHDDPDCADVTGRAGST